MLDYNYGRSTSQVSQFRRLPTLLRVSLGGLLTAYMGMTNAMFLANRGVLYAFWAGPNFIITRSTPRPAAAHHLHDIGSNESSSAKQFKLYWLDAFGVSNTWLCDGYALNSELLLYPKCGACTTKRMEWAWPVFPNSLLAFGGTKSIALEKFPPRLELLNCDPANGTGASIFSRPWVFLLS